MPSEAERRALERAAMIAHNYYLHLSNNGHSFLEHSVASDIRDDIRALIATEAAAPSPASLDAHTPVYYRDGFVDCTCGWKGTNGANDWFQHVKSASLDTAPHDLSVVPQGAWGVKCPLTAEQWYLQIKNCIPTALNEHARICFVAANYEHYCRTFAPVAPLEKAVRVALKGLIADTVGLINAHEVAIRQDSGNTNLACVERRIIAARNALALGASQNSPESRSDNPPATGERRRT